MITAKRYHDISCGHRVVGHESKCALLHGHNYRIHFTCRAAAGNMETDSLGRVIDFGVMKEKLCMWVEANWDHKFIAYTKDEVMRAVDNALYLGREATADAGKAWGSIVWVDFNPTAENLADHLLRKIGPVVLDGTGVELISVMIEETRKCSAEVTLG